MVRSAAVQASPLPAETLPRAESRELGQLDQAGCNVEMLLRGVPDFVDRAHTPAAFAYRSIDDRLDGRVYWAPSTAEHRRDGSRGFNAAV